MKPRYAARVDASHREIVDALLRIGCDVQEIGLPVDLLVGYRARNFLIEIKTPGVAYKGTKKQKEFIKAWKGQVRTVETPEEAIQLVTRAYQER